MANNVFISFRYADGSNYKKELANLFNKYYDTVDYSEDEDRSNMSEETIRNYLYKKLRRSSVTIILLTPLAVNHKKNFKGKYDDWMSDEIRYSLEKDSTTILNVDNLFRKNMMNVKPAYKRNPKQGIYDANYDSYCSLIEYSLFINNPGKYIDMALEKRNIKERYNIVKRI